MEQKDIDEKQCVRDRRGGPPSAPSPKKIYKFTNKLPTRAVSAPTYLPDSDTESEHSFTSSDSPTSSKANQQTEEVKYTITKKGDSWLVTIFIDAKETYVVPDFG